MKDEPSVVANDCCNLPSKIDSKTKEHNLKEK